MELVKKEKQEPLRKGDELDKLAESRLLSQQELDFKQCIKERLAHILERRKSNGFKELKLEICLEGMQHKIFLDGGQWIKKKNKNFWVRMKGVKEGKEN